MTDHTLRQDQIHDLLSDPHRRRTLEYLATEETAPLDDVRDFVARTSDTTTDETRIAVALVHNHLPRLEDAGVITYDHENGHVDASDLPEELREYLPQPESWLPLELHKAAD